MQLMIEAVTRADGRIALLHGDTLVAHLPAGTSLNGHVPPEPDGGGNAASGNRRGRPPMTAAPATTATARRPRKNSPSAMMARRAKALLRKGKSVNAVAKEIGTSWHIVNQWKAELDDNGAEADEEEDEDAAPAEKVVGTKATAPMRRCPVCKAPASGRYCPNNHDVLLDT